jgi:hypothetical protein
VLRSTLIFLTLLLSPVVTAHQTIEINGKKLEYEISGDGPLSVLFDAGALTGMAGWDALWDGLPENVTAVRFSRLGEGKSEACEGQRTSTEHVEEVQALLLALKVKKPFVYVGHSLGGATARNYASVYPKNVLGILTVDPENPRDIEIITEIEPEYGPDEIETIKRNDYKLSNGKWCFLDAIWKKDSAKDFNDIGDIPVTLIATTMQYENPQTIFNSDVGRKRWGEIQRDWVNTFPQGEFVATDKSGHYIQQSEPDLVLNELSKLIKRIQVPNEDSGIDGKWRHSIKPAIIEFNLGANTAVIFQHNEADSAGFNLIKNISRLDNLSEQWVAEMYDGYQGKYVAVSIVKAGNKLRIMTEDGVEVLVLVR